MSMRTEILKYERIRNLRIDGGLTQKQIAKLLNVSQNTYSQYEIGITRYPLDVVVTLAQYYHVSVDYLVGLTDETTPYPRKRQAKP
nr:helix-turn-helix transcriptional regulator [uncultured Oscillibacter sp.]